MGQPIPVVDARVNRETYFHQRFAPIVPWRLFSRNNWDTYGSSPVTSRGFLLPYYPTDLITSMSAFENPLGNSGTTTTSSTATSIISNQVFLMPPHGALTIPAQNILAKLQIGVYLAGGTSYISSVTLGLVKVAAAGTVTQLATATNSTEVGGGGTTYTLVSRDVTITVASDLSIAADERLGFRLSTTGRNSGGFSANHCLNANGGTPFAETSTAATASQIIFRYK